MSNWLEQALSSGERWSPDDPTEMWEARAMALAGQYFATLQQWKDQYEALHACRAHLLETQDNWQRNVDQWRERAEAAEAELATIKRTDMHRDDVQGMLSNAHAGVEFMREQRNNAITQLELAEEAIARVADWGARMPTTIPAALQRSFWTALRGENV